MSTGYMINITKAEAIQLLMLWHEYQAYKADHEFPPPGAAGLSRYTLQTLEHLFDNLARWVVMTTQGGSADGIAQVTAKNFEASLPEAKARMDRRGSR